MPNRVILHLGVHKTGTTSIQKLLYDVRNQGSLLKSGVHYVRALGDNHSEFFQSAFSESPERYHSNQSKGYTKEAIRIRTAQQKKQAKEELLGLYQKTIIFSGEDGCVLSSESINFLKEFLAEVVRQPFEAHVLIYTRDPVSYVESAIQENVKGNGMTLESAKDWHISASREHYENIFRTFLGHFGRENIFFRSFEEACRLGGGVVEDFASFCGFSVGDLQVVRENQAIADEVVRIMSEGNRHKVRISAMDRSVLMRLPGQRSSLLCGDDVRSILALAKSDIEFLENEFGISYRRTAQFDAPISEIFSETFVVGLNQVFSLLEPATRDLIMRVLR